MVGSHHFGGVEQHASNRQDINTVNPDSRLVPDGDTTILRTDFQASQSARLVGHVFGREFHDCRFANPSIIANSPQRPNISRIRLQVLQRVVGLVNLQGIRKRANRSRTVIQPVIAMIIIYILPKFTKAVPSSLVAIVVVTLLSLVIALPTKTIGDLSSIAGGLPQFHIPMVPVNLETISIVLPYSIVMALVGLIESLLTLEVVDEMTNTRGKPNRETYAQGIANTICGFFSGMGGCAMIGQSIVNINSGGRHRLSGIISAITLLCIVLFASPVVNIIPMAALVGVMFMVSFNTFKWESFKLVHNVPNIDVVVMVVVTLVTVIFDNLALAVILGVVISALSFAWENSKRITAIVSYDKEHDVKYYEIQGPLFFGSTSSFKELFDYDGDPDSVVINFSQSRVMDHSAIDIINEVTAKYAKRGKKVLLSYLSRDSADLLDNAEGLIEVNYLDDPYYRIPHDELD